MNYLNSDFIMLMTIIQCPERVLLLSIANCSLPLLAIINTVNLFTVYTPRPQDTYIMKYLDPDSEMFKRII